MVIKHMPGVSFLENYAVIYDSLCYLLYNVLSRLQQLHHEIRHETYAKTTVQVTIQHFYKL